MVNRWTRVSSRASWRAASQILRSCAGAGLWLLLATPLQAEQALVAVASNFAAPMESLVARFEAQSPHRLQVSAGSSGRFYAQIRNGAPYDVFFSADQARPLALEQDGLVVPDSRFTYGLGSLVLWSPDPGLLQAGGEVLGSDRYRRLAMANPRLAPYGAAARSVLDGLGLTAAVQGRVVQGENIAQAFQFVASGNAELGFVALSQLIATGRVGVDGNVVDGSAWLLPAELHQPIRQDVLLLTRAADNSAAREFLAFVRDSDAAAAILSEFGYSRKP